MEGALVDLLSFGVICPTTTTTYEEGSPPQDPTRVVRLAIQRTCQELLPDIVGLTDAFGFTDWELDRLVPPFSFFYTHYFETCNNPTFYFIFFIYLFLVRWEFIMVKCMKLYGIVHRWNR